MDLTFAVFALLPLGLFSFLSKGRRSDAGIGFLAALAPVLGSALGGLFNRKSKQSEQQREIDYRRELAEQEEAQNRQRWEAAQSSPQAQMQRLGFNTKLSRILGGFGGRGQTPQFILDAFDSARGPQEYTPGAEFIAPPKQGGGFWDYAGDLAGAASYFDTSRYGKGGQQASPGVQQLPAATDQTAAVFGGGQQGPTLAKPSSFRNQDFQLGQRR